MLELVVLAITLILLPTVWVRQELPHLHPAWFALDCWTHFGKVPALR